MTHTDTCAATLEECERSGSPRVRLDGLLLTADGAVPLLVSTLKPASSHIESLALTQCGLSEAAWLPAGHLHSITRLELQDCTNAVPGSSLTSVLDAALQQMSRLRSLQISDCDLSSGLPDALRQLRSIDDLYINDAQLASLPPLACMEGRCCDDIGAHDTCGLVVCLDRTPKQPPYRRRLLPVPFSGLECLDLDGNVFAEMPSLGSAPRLTTLRINQEFELVLDAASARRLAAEAPNLCHLSIGGPVAAGVWLAKQLPQLDVL